jgi:adenosylcobinamide-phosphate synthase
MMSLASFVLAYTLDWLIGDPTWWPHPVRWMGQMIRSGEGLLRKVTRTPSGEFVAGLGLTVLVVGTFGVGSWAVLRWLQAWNQTVGIVVSVFLAASTLATRSLLDEAREVIRFLASDDLLSAQRHLARIVGRDTHELDAQEVIRATIETLAESACDGVVAPMFYLAIGGVPAALAYKAINTLDSMIGHRDKQYEFFGKCAARSDDAASYVPARLTALLLVAGAWTLKLNWRDAWRILHRDGGKHESPNAGRPEAAMAGALGVRLGGTNFYDGEAHYGQHIGDAESPLDHRALRKALHVTACVSLLMFVLCLSLWLLIPSW